MVPLGFLVLELDTQPSAEDRQYSRITEDPHIEVDNGQKNHCGSLYFLAGLYDVFLRVPEIDSFPRGCFSAQVIHEFLRINS